MSYTPTDFDEELSENSAKPSRAHHFAMMAAAIVVIFVGILLLSRYSRKTVANPTPNQSLVSAPQSAENPVIVDVDGRVKNPGVYELPFGSRVYQAIEKAGGALNDADLSKLNRADWAEDGSKIFIPSKNIEKTPSPISAPSDNTAFADTEFPTIATEKPENLNSEPLPENPSQPAPAQKTNPPKSAPTNPPKSAPQKKELPTQPIDLNRATAEQLQRLPGIGPATAQRILQYRKEINGFTQPNDLLEVRGIGEKTMQKLSPHIVVKPLPHQNSKTE